MSANLSRQLKDVQSYAEQLLRGKPSPEDIRNFGQYSQELKHYILEHIKVQEILDLAMEIPTIELETSPVKSGLSILFNPGVISYWWRQRKQIDAAMLDIQFAKSKFASIEFLCKAYL